MRSKPNGSWFWAWLIEMTVPKLSIDDPKARVEVWKNLVILRAVNAEEALSKAFKMGALDEGDCRGTLRLNGKPATTKFLGVGGIGLIHEDLEDGAEILWQLKKCRQDTAEAMVISKRDLLARLRKETVGLAD